jgi:hypothetical protein
MLIRVAHCIVPQHGITRLLNELVNVETTHDLAKLRIHQLASFLMISGSYRLIDSTR